jgi:hypothetical protein
MFDLLITQSPPKLTLTKKGVKLRIKYIGRIVKETLGFDWI